MDILFDQKYHSIPLSVFYYYYYYTCLKLLLEEQNPCESEVYKKYIKIFFYLDIHCTSAKCTYSNQECC